MLMNWEKNVFSYMLWVVYTAAVCAGFFVLSAAFCEYVGYPPEYGFAGAAGVLALVGPLVCFACKAFRRFEAANRRNTVSAQIAESFCLVLLLALGLYLRVRQLGGITEPEGMAYFEAARVAADQTIPQVVHGITYLYLQLLHGLLILLGNHVYAALGLQIALQLSGGAVFYLTVRRWSGALAGLVTTAFFMLSPTAISASVCLSPTAIWLFLYGLVLCWVTWCLEKRRLAALWAFLAGLMTGAVVYLDFSGCTLLLFVLAVLTAQREEAQTFWQRRAAVALCAMAGAAAGFLVVIGLDSLVSGREYSNVLTAWCEIYRPETFSLSALEILPTSAKGLQVLEGSVLSGVKMLALTMTEPAFAEGLVLFGTLTVGIFGFWCRRKLECQGVWIAATAAMAALQGFGMLEQHEGAELFLWLFLAVLAGIGVESVFAADSPGRERELQAEEELPVEDLEEDTEQVSAEEEPEASQVPRVQYIENPLPLPKKHQPKILDYHITALPPGDDYDHAVAEEDDFDL